MKFDTEGHRGCRGLMPENTIPGFITALDFGVNTLEMDVVITKDRKVIVSHDPYFNHEITTKADGSFVSEEEEKKLNIYEMTYSQTLGFDVGLKKHPRFPNQQKLKVNKPLLLDVIEAVEAYIVANKLPLVQYNIETKSLPETDSIFHPIPSEFVELLVSVLIEKKIQDRVIVQSFDKRTLQYLNEHFPKVRTSFLYEGTGNETLPMLLKDLGFTPTIYSPDFKLVTPRLVKSCKELGIQLIPWTVNELNEIRALKEIGVDGVISDYPNLFGQL